ncbi:flavodoxin [Cryptosporangium japonicum]|uniref:Flavodoxin family protein n=1 Tax=Cryptosporangium japonicum TaxID=80872 RepID=A0ABN0TJG8_9ACTN
MRSLVIVESMFGNTRTVADAVAEGLAPAGPVTVLDLADAPPAPHVGVDLLVIGGPTHAFGLSRPNTRHAAEQQGAAHRARGIREWLADLSPCLPGTAAAAFTTRIPKKFVTGSAAKAAARQLERHGYRRAAPPEDFFVLDTVGPLRDGELDHAKAWGRRLAASLQDRTREGEAR